MGMIYLLTLIYLMISQREKVFKFSSKYSEKSVDYPKFAKKLCNKVNKSSMGILICGSGIGVSISANRHKHIRASLCHNVNSARMTRKHNDSNVICLQGRPFVKKKIFAMLDAYFDTEFEEGRHTRRVEQL